MELIERFKDGFEIREREREGVIFAPPNFDNKESSLQNKPKQSFKSLLVEVTNKNTRRPKILYLHFFFLLKMFELIKVFPE